MSFDRAGVDHPSCDADAPRLSQPLSTYLMCLRLPLASPTLAPRARHIQQCVTPLLAPNARWRRFPRARALTSAPHHPPPRPSSCVVSLTLCLRPIPLSLRQFPRPLRVASIPPASAQTALRQRPMSPLHVPASASPCYTAHLKHEQRGFFL